MRHPLSLRDIELPRFDPFGLPAFDTRPSLLGMPVVIEEPRPRYVLPADVPPPTGMTREQFAAWSARVCGFAPPLIKDGEMLQSFGALHMNRATFRDLQRHLDTQAHKRPTWTR